MVPIHEFLKATDDRADQFIHERLKRKRFEPAKREEMAEDQRKRELRILRIKSRRYALCNPTGNYRKGAKSLSLEELRRYCLEKMRREERREYDKNGELQKITTIKIKPIEQKTEKHNIKYKPVSGMSFGDNLTYRKAGWGKAFGSIAQKDGTTAYSSYDSTTAGFAIGGDWQVDKSSIMGVGISYAQSDISGNNGLKNTTLDTYQLKIYGSRLFEDNVFLNASLGFAWNFYDTARTIAVASVTANANYEGQSYIAKVRGGKVYNSYKDSNFDIIPEISATFVDSTFDAYEETGANTLNLNVQAGADQYLEGRIGFNVNYNKRDKQDVKNNKILTRYRYHNSYGHNFLNKKQKTTANFVGRSQRFTTTSDADGSGSFRIGLGMDITKEQSNVVSLDVTADFIKNYIAHSGSLKYKHEF